MQTTTSVITLPSIKELFNDQRISVESRNHSACIPSCKLPTLSLSIPCPKFQLASPIERNVDDSMTGYHHKGNQYQNDLLRLPSISTMGQMGDSNNNNRNVVTSVQKHSRPNSIQSLISPPESPDMINNPSFEDHETHPRLAHPEHHYPSNAGLLSTPHYQAQTYVPEQHRYDRVGGYRQERVVYDHSYTEQRAYPSSKTSPTTLQPAFSPYESRPVTTPPTLHRLDIPSPVSKNVNTIPRRLSPKIVNDQQLTLPVSGGPSSNNRYQCPYCSKRFSRPSSLRIHTYSHTGEKPFVCTESGCGRKFSVQSNMRRHLRVHRLGRPVKKVRYDGEVEGVKMLNHGPIMRSC